VQLLSHTYLSYACRIVHYAKFVDSLKDTEEGPGCEHCTDNRLLLEHAWQVVANEFYDPAGRFSQAKWADQLLSTLKVIRLPEFAAMSSQLIYVIEFTQYASDG